MLKRIIWASFLSLTVFLFMPASLAMPVDTVPNPYQSDGSWVIDQADLLSSTTEAKLNQIISELNAKNSSEVAVVTVPETSPSKTPQQFATDLFERWHIDKLEEKPGVLFLISKTDRRVEIKVGLRAILLLPNSQVSRIISSLIIPQFKQCKFDKGTIAGTQAIVAALQTHSSVSDSTLKTFPLWSRWLILLMVIVGVPAISLRLDSVLKPKPGTMSYQEYCERYGDYYSGSYGSHGGSGGYSGGGGCSGGGAGGSW